MLGPLYKTQEAHGNTVPITNGGERPRRRFGRLLGRLVFCFPPSHPTKDWGKTWFLEKVTGGEPVSGLALVWLLGKLSELHD